MSSFRLNESAFGEHVLKAKWLEAEMLRRAELVKARAIATAPVDRHHDPKKGVPYKDAFVVVAGVRPKGYDPLFDHTFRTTRVFARVMNTKYYARHVEYGTGYGKAGRSGFLGKDEEGNDIVQKRNTPRFRVLGRALDAAKG